MADLRYASITEKKSVIAASARYAGVPASALTTESRASARCASQMIEWRWRIPALWWILTMGSAASAFIYIGGGGAGGGWGFEEPEGGDGGESEYDI
jgi:hypothetical protein